jgi:hypothetical protein
MTEIIRARAAGRLSAVIAEAFRHLPPSRRLVSAEAARREILPGYFRLHVDHALASGVVCTTEPRRSAGSVQLRAGAAAGAPMASPSGGCGS